MGYLINSAIFGSKKARQIENNKQHKDNLKLKEERNKLKQEELKLKKAELNEKLKEREYKAKLKAEELEAKKVLRIEKENNSKKAIVNKSINTIPNNTSNPNPKSNDNLEIENCDKLFIPILKFVISARIFTLNEIKEEFQVGTNRLNRILNELTKYKLIYTIDDLEFHSKYSPTDELQEIISEIKSHAN